MLYVVSYDISCPKRLKKIADCCELYGGRIEKSVFEVDLDDALFQRFWQELQEKMAKEEDSIIAYKICASCEKAILTTGKAKRSVQSRCLVVG